MKVSVLGAGAWGTALAAAVSVRHPTLLWARDGAQARQIQLARRNQRYLPDVALPEALAVTADRGAALAHVADGGLLVIATPMSALREQLQALPPTLPAVWLCKGFERDSGLLGHELALAVRPQAACGTLSGPSFAVEVARGQPTALVAASENVALAQATVAACHSEALRVYTSTDVIGVEVGGAVKNVLAIATGIVDGMPEPGLNARAALITRGLAEMTRLGVALGARAETFMGLSGLGDLVLTATGDLSRNRRVGLLLARGLSLPQILRELGHVAEGVQCAATVLARARALAIEMPITEAVVDVVEGRLTPRDAMARLMGRQARAEDVGAAQTPPA